GILAEYWARPHARPAGGAWAGCLEELEPVPEPIPLARKILSSVARVGQRFGVAHVTNVLRGHASEQVLARRHQELSTFGLLKDAPAAEIRGYIEQLIAYRLLRQTDDAYPVLTLTPTGLALMKDPASEPDLTLARPAGSRAGVAAPSAAI